MKVVDSNENKCDRSTEARSGESENDVDECSVQSEIEMRRKQDKTVESNWLA